MVMTIVPFYKHGRPWSDHGQLMVISWSTMVNDHDQPWSNHGRPWSDHDPVARDSHCEKPKYPSVTILTCAIHIFLRFSAD